MDLWLNPLALNRCISVSFCGMEIIFTAEYMDLPD
jgi:hypothetical protein